jgi:hypothetical protein
MSKYLKKAMNQSLFFKRTGSTVFEAEEKVLDGILGDFDDFRKSFSKTLKKHIEKDGQSFPTQLTDPVSMSLTIRADERSQYLFK